MSECIEIDVRGIGKPRMTRSDSWKRRECVLRYWEYKDTLVMGCLKENYVIGDRVSIEFVFRVPESMSRKKGEELLKAGKHQVKPDLDNLVKGVLDSLKERDQEVYYIEASKRWGEEDKIIMKNL